MYVQVGVILMVTARVGCFFFIIILTPHLIPVPVQTAYLHNALLVVLSVRLFSLGSFGFCWLVWHDTTSKVL